MRHIKRQRTFGPWPTSSSSRLLSTLALVGLLHASALATTPEGPLPDDWVKAFSNITPDPKPKSLVRNANYVVSNERKIHLFQPEISDLGGIYIGVGTDQNYTFAGWARPEILILMDFDQVVVNVHKAYEAAFTLCATPEDFLTFWSAKQKKASTQAIAEYYKSQPELAAAASKAFKMAQKWVEVRFERTRPRFKRGGVLTFLDDPKQYAYLRRMFEEKRVYAVRGDLTKQTTMTEIAALATRFKVPVRLVYTSNAEQYFKYGRGSNFKANMRALPFDDKSRVIRTMASGGSTYKYYVQDGLKHHKWMENPRTYSVWAILNTSPRLIKDRLYRLWREPRVKKKRKKKKKKAPQ